MDTPVSFELAKLLKEKEFEDKVHQYYRDGKLVKLSSDANIIFANMFAAPTIAEVVMWLYEKHGIWVYCEINKDKFYAKAKKVKSNWRRVVSGVVNNENILFNSPTEAYEAGIEYTLNNLIKSNL